jgi:hypothetical protein
MIGSSLTFNPKGEFKKNFTVNINCSDVFGNEFKSGIALDFPKLESFESFDSHHRMGSEDGHHGPSQQNQPNGSMKLAMLGFGLAFVGVCLNACLVYLFWKSRSSDVTPEPENSTAMVTEPADQAKNKTNNDFAKVIDDLRLKNENKPSPKSDKTDPDSEDSSWP